MIKQGVCLDVEYVECDDEYFYDLEVEDTHNYFANNCIVHNCGSGKTIALINLIVKCRQPALVIVPNDNSLLKQWVKNVEDVLGVKYKDRNDYIGIIGDGYYDYKNKYITIAMNQSIYNHRDDKELFKSFGFVCMDECFYKDTLITMSDSTKKKISEINVGDTILNSNGIDTVEKVIVNNVPLERLVLLKLNNGNEILTTLDHKFYTENGWTECHNLKVGELLYGNKDMHLLWKEIQQVGWNVNIMRRLQICYLYLSTMWKRIQNSCIRLRKRTWNKILFEQVLHRFIKRKKTLFGIKKENVRISQTMESNRTRKTSCKEKFGTNETIQSNVEPREYRQNDSNKNKKWNFGLVRSQRWKWGIYRPTMETMCCINSFNKNRSSFGICDRHKRKRKSFEWLSNKLQSRPCLSKSETCNRSRWGIPQFGMGQSKGFEEAKNAEQIRVESLTFYKQGNRREYFERYISDKERTCGYIEMYDLTVRNKHNYIANDVLVHNCHMITNESWNILLKDLEEPPEYAILILCTTNPEKIPETILSRCQIYEFHSIKQNDIANRLRYICEQEEFDYEDDAMDIIAKHSKGGMRDAISSLEQVACFSNGNITKQDTIDSLGIISDDCFIEIANCLYDDNIDGAIEVLDSLVDKNKPLLSIFYQLQELYGDEQKAFFRKTKENILQYGRNSLLEITKLFIEYESKMKYSNDKYFILTSLFYDISHIGNNASIQNIFQDSDIEKRILALEDALKNGKLQNFEKIGNIQRALNGKKVFPTKDERRKEGAKQKQVDDIVSEFASLSKGEIL